MSNLIENLNHMLSLENASIDRIVSRIDHTPIEEVRERLKKHLEETLIQKDRLIRIITELGGKNTDAKEDKDMSEVTTINQTKNFAKIMKLTEDPSGDNSVPEEDELAEIKQDYIIEDDELVAYESLISKMQTMNIAHHMIRSLERSMQEEESMAYRYKVHTALILDSLWPKMIYRSIRRGQRFLLNHVSSKVPLIVMYADLVGSTSMSMTLPVDQLVAIIRAFTHHISRVVDGFDGYVLKYVGDAVISFFPSPVNTQNKYLASEKPLECAKSMINIIREEINAILNKKYGYPELFTKIGIDAGQNAIIQYGPEQLSPIDILGYSMNLAAKITSMTGPDKISIGDNVYKSLNCKIQHDFHEVAVPDNQWKYVNYGTSNPYKVYTMNS